MNTLSSAVSTTPAALAPVRLLPLWLSRAVVAVVGALRSSGEARARAELLAYADRCESLQPQLAAELRAAGARLVVR